MTYWLAIKKERKYIHVMYSTTHVHTSLTNLKVNLTNAHSMNKGTFITRKTVNAFDRKSGTNR